MKKTNVQKLIAILIIGLLMMGGMESCDKDKNDDSNEPVIASPKVFEAYHCGLDLLKDETSHAAAFEKIKEASDAGFDSASVMLAKMYEYGIGTKQNIELANDIYSQMSKNGNKFAVNKQKSINNFNCRIESPKGVTLPMSNTFVLCDSLYGLPNGNGTFKTDANSIRVVNSDNKLIYMSYRHPKQPESEIIKMNSQETAITLIMCCIPFSFDILNYDFFVGLKKEISSLSCTRNLQSLLDDKIKEKGFFELSDIFPMFENIFESIEGKKGNEHANTKATLLPVPYIMDGDYCLYFSSELAIKSQINTNLFDDTKYVQKDNCWKTHFRVTNRSSYPLSMLPGHYDIATNQFWCMYNNNSSYNKYLLANLIPPSNAIDFSLTSKGLNFFINFFRYTLDIDEYNLDLSSNLSDSYLDKVQQTYRDAQKSIANHKDFNLNISSDNNSIKYYFPSEEGILIGYFVYYELFKFVDIIFEVYGDEKDKRIKDFINDPEYFGLAMSLTTEEPKIEEFVEQTIIKVLKSLSWKQLPIIRNGISWWDCFTSSDENIFISVGTCTGAEVLDIAKFVGKEGYGLVALGCQEVGNIISQIATRNDASFVIPFSSSAFVDNPIEPEDPNNPPSEEEKITLLISVSDRTEKIPTGETLTYDYGQNVTFTAAVSPSNHVITIYDGQTKTDLKNGFNINTLSIGKHPINVWVDYDSKTGKGKVSSVVYIDIKEKQEEQPTPQITSVTITGYSNPISNGDTKDFDYGDEVQIAVETDIDCDEISVDFPGYSPKSNNGEKSYQTPWFDATESGKVTITATKNGKSSTFYFNIEVEEKAQTSAPKITSVKVNESPITDGKKIKSLNWGDNVEIEVTTDIDCDEISIDYPNIFNDVKRGENRSTYSTSFKAEKYGKVTIVATKNGKTDKFEFSIMVFETVDAGGLPNDGAQKEAHKYSWCNDLVFQSAEKANFEGSYWVSYNGEDEYNRLVVSKKESGKFTSKQIRLIVSTSITDLSNSNIIKEQLFQGGENNYYVDITPTSKQLYLIVYVGGDDCGSVDIDGYYCGPFYYHDAQ